MSSLMHSGELQIAEKSNLLRQHTHSVRIHSLYKFSSVLRLLVTSACIRTKGHLGKYDSSPSREQLGPGSSSPIEA